MFRNGIYKISYCQPVADRDIDWSLSEHALAVMRESKLIGADRHGAVFVGEPIHSSEALETIRVQLTVPPGGELVNGARVGPQGASITLRGQFDPTLVIQTTHIDLEGVNIALCVQYLGPLPE